MRSLNILKKFRISSLPHWAGNAGIMYVYDTVCHVRNIFSLENLLTALSCQKKKKKKPTRFIRQNITAWRKVTIKVQLSTPDCCISACLRFGVCVECGSARPFITLGSPFNPSSRKWNTPMALLQSGGAICSRGPAGFLSMCSISREGPWGTGACWHGMCGKWASKLH